MVCWVHNAGAGQSLAVLGLLHGQGATVLPLDMLINNGGAGQRVVRFKRVEPGGCAGVASNERI